eukprot:g24569.t1
MLRQDGKFPMITLKKDLELTGSKPGATLKMYDDDWFGNAVTVVEMDGEIDMDNMEEQLKEPGLGRAVRLRSRCCAEPNEGWTTPRQNEIESNMEGLGAKSASELTEAMVGLKSSPGSQNGTGLLQTVIAMKVREIYEKITGKER